MRVKFTLGIGISNAIREDIIEIPKDLGLTNEEWKHLTETEKDVLILEEWQIWKNNLLDGGWRYEDKEE